MRDKRSGTAYHAGRHVSVKILMASTDSQCLKGPLGDQVLTVGSTKLPEFQPTGPGNVKKRESSNGAMKGIEMRQK